MSAVEKQTIMYPTELRSRIRQLGGKIVKSPLPQISASHVPEKAVNRKKPFKDNGEGYADAVIWESVLALAKLYTDNPPVNFPKIILISNNSRDFCDANSHTLHRDLLNELTILGIDQSVIAITPTLESASDILDTYITTDEYREMETLDFLTGIRFESSELKNLLDEEVRNALSLKSLDNDEIGLGPTLEDPTINSMEEHYDYRDMEVEVFNKDEIFVSMNISVNCFLDVFIEKMNTIDLDDARLTIYDNDWNDHYVAAQLEMVIPFKLQFITNDTLNEVSGFEVEVVPSDN
jgi:hypothetical protein